MSVLLEVPRIADLDFLPVEVSTPGDLGVVSVTSWASDGAVVTVTWDEIAGSVSVRWLDAEGERMILERDAASKVSIRDERGQIEFWVWSEAEGFGGQLVVRIGEHVTVSDVLLRK